MHRSRVGSIVIDCDDIAAGTSFWSGALGAEVQAQDERYVSLGAAAGGLRVLLQKVPERKTAKSRMHLDIETDDVAAEVRRLEELGARRVQQTDPHSWVMYDPCGNEFCVIAPETEGFPERARVWEP
jgi:catechol 2,3-dioxygenase-like lactoylglutathione lyase family enzyme